MDSEGIRIVQIVTPTGDVKTLQLFRFSALDGWNIQSRFREFAASHDSAVRKRYVLDVLQYCKVIIQDRELPLTTSALIDNHLGSAANIQDVFEEILKLNEIDPETHGREPSFWEKAGEEIAASFVTEFFVQDGAALLQTIKRRNLIKLAQNG